MALQKLLSTIFPASHIPLRSALDEIEAERFVRTSGASVFGYPVRLQAAISNFLRSSSWAFLVTLFLGLLVGMWAVDALPSLFGLRWTQRPRDCELPDVVRREMIRGAEGRLEVLVLEKKGKRKRPAVLFVHGGFGSAGMWVPWMRFLDDGEYAGNLYALSLRGHGGSFSPGFLEMTYLTSMTTLSADVAAALRWIAEREDAAGNQRGVIIAAHSAGGGLVQHAIASGKFPVKALARIGGLKGLALIASIPPFGSAGVYLNWLFSDPFIFMRTYLHFGHPRSPLASISLVRRAFFSEGFPDADVREFEKAMPKYESLIWPTQMMFGRFVDIDDILAQMSSKNRNVLIIAADGDRLMGVRGQRQMAREYANVLRAEDMEEKFTNMHDVRIEAEGTIAGQKDERGSYGSLQLNLIRGSGHHLQNDVKRDEAAEVFKTWAENI